MRGFSLRWMIVANADECATRRCSSFCSSVSCGFAVIVGICGILAVRVT
jgi:hypothetical protein